MATNAFEEITPVEHAVSTLYVAFFNLRKAGRYQEEYDAMGTLMNMLARDRQHLREKCGVTP